MAFLHRSKGRRAFPSAMLSFFLSSILWTGAALATPPSKDQTEKLGISSQRQNSKESKQLTELSLEDLMNVKVTSVAKKEQNISDAAAAIYVLTQEEIRRSGANSLPDLLRLIPGVNVARINGYVYAVGVRGFNEQLSNKLLVMIDGHTIYSPITSGVNWQNYDVVLEDIDHIEVIRGPGGTLWGANAVNGVINIITKSAKKTPGFLAVVGGGIEEKKIATFRYGFQLSEKVFLRASTQYKERDELQNFKDTSSKLHGGLRLDAELSENDQLMFKTDYTRFLGNREAILPDFDKAALEVREYSPNTHYASFDGSWKRRLNERSDLQLKVFYDYQRVNNPITPGSAFRVHQQDFDFQHRIEIPSARQELLWGAGYRAAFLRRFDTGGVQGPDIRTTDHLFSGFIQDEITLVPHHLHLTLGSKFEHATRDGFQFQPSARLAWKINPEHTTWLAFSRVVRTPSFVENTSQYKYDLTPPANGAPPIWTTVLGNPNLDSEKLYALEWGYRAQPSERFSIDVAGFLNFYQDVVLIDLNGPPQFNPIPYPHVDVGIQYQNGVHGKTYGGELALSVKPFHWWHLKANYSLLLFDLESKSLTRTPDYASGRSPRHQANVWSRMNLPYNIELDFGLRFVDGLPYIAIPSYLEGTVRLAWKPIPSLELAVIGQDIFHASHAEFEPIDISDQRILRNERKVYGKLTWNWK